MSDKPVEPSANDLATFFELSNELMVLADDQLTILKVNPAFEKVLGWQEDQLIGKNAFNILFEDDKERVTAQLGSLSPDEPNVIIQCSVQSVQGTFLEMEWHVKRLYEKKQVLGVARTVTEAHAPERFFTLALEASPAAMIVADNKGSIRYANPAAHHLLGYATGELLDRDIETLVPPEFREEHPDMREDFIEKQERRPIDHLDGLKAIRKDGQTIEVQIGIMPVTIGGEKLAVCSMLDVSKTIREESVIREQARQLSKANQRLSHLANTDELTNLANRRVLMEQMELLLLDATINREAVSLIFVDIDLFKQFNDSYGHPTGDVLLGEFARLLSENARASDLVCRYGGEEFALLLPGARRQAAIEISERMRMLIEEHRWQPRQITASFGVATIQPAEMDKDADALVDLLLAQADKAMYHSKQQGRNRVTHFDSLGINAND
jgi:diguanylate cyclase (GGDEF)-like protein/PAS domain S-box-containing protein